jgi:hypothetical protein
MVGLGMFGGFVVPPKTKVRQGRSRLLRPKILRLSVCGGHQGTSRLLQVTSHIAACGFGLLVALTAPLWLGPAQNWLGPLKNWLPRVSSPEQAGTQVPQASGAAWSDEEIKTALMHCVQAVAPLNADVAPLSPLRSGECGTPALCS